MKFLTHLAHTAVMAVTIGMATLVVMAFVIDGSPMIAAGLLAGPWLN